MGRTRTDKELTSTSLQAYEVSLLYTNDLRRQRDSNPQAVLPTNCFQDSPTTIITYLQVIAESIGIEPNPGLTERNAQQAPAITIKRYSPNRFLQVTISHSATQAYSPGRDSNPRSHSFELCGTPQNLYILLYQYVKELKILRCLTVRRPDPYSGELGGFEPLFPELRSRQGIRTPMNRLKTWHPNPQMNRPNFKYYLLLNIICFQYNYNIVSSNLISNF